MNFVAERVPDRVLRCDFQHVEDHEFLEMFSSLGKHLILAGWAEKRSVPKSQWHPDFTERGRSRFEQVRQMAAELTEHKYELTIHEWRVLICLRLARDISPETDPAEL